MMTRVYHFRFATPVSTQLHSYLGIKAN